MAGNSLPQKLTLPLMQTQWAQKLNPVLSNPLTQGLALTGIKLSSGNTVINHTLGRVQQGWFITDIDGAATIYRPDSAPLNGQTLTLCASAAVTINLWVY